MSTDPVVQLPASVLGIDVDVLHLDRASRRALRAAGITTVGELAGAGYVSQRGWDALGGRAGKAASRVVAHFATFSDGETVDIPAFWAARGIAVIPMQVGGGQDQVAALLAELPALVRATLADEPSAWQHDSNRDWVIVDGRNGLVSAPKTLDELGSGVLGLTRERVRQVEAKAMDRLRNAWAERFHGTDYRLSPNLDPVLTRVAASLPVAGTAVFEDALLQTLDLPDRPDVRAERRLVFLLELAGCRRIAPDGDRRPAVWVASADVAMAACVALADRVGRLLTETTGEPMTEQDITAEVNRGRRSGRVSLAEVTAALPLSRLVERLEDGRWQGRFEHLTRRGDQAHRVLVEAGRPLTVEVIAREVNARTLGRPVEVRNLSNQISGDERFAPTGRTGEWGLRTAGVQPTPSVLEVMQDTLRRAGHPLSTGEIRATVEQVRPVAASSINTYLSSRSEFTHLTDGRWALSSWPEAAVARRAAAAKGDPGPSQAERISRLIVPYLESAPDHERRLSDVVAFIEVQTGIPRAAVYLPLKKVREVERADRDGHATIRLVKPSAVVPVDPAAAGLRQLILAGETPKVEFKSSLRWDTHNDVDNPGLQKMCTKTIAAFANTAGGTLIIGVAPDGSVYGIERDGAILQKKDDTCIDAFSRALAVIVAQHLGGALSARITTHFVPLDGLTVCVVEVPPGGTPAYLRDGRTTEFYVRNGTTSRTLDLSEVADYVRSRWP